MKFVKYIIYIISHIYVVNHSWKLDILKYILNFQSFKISHFQKYEFFKVCYNHLIFFIINLFLLYESFEISLQKCFFVNEIKFHL
jgi:hypothetical protein